LSHSNAQHQLSDDGKQLVLLDDRALTYRNLTNHEVRVIEMPTNTVGSIYLSPSGDRIAARIYNKVYVWNVADGKMAYSPMVHIATVGHVDFSPDGRRILTCCWDGRYTKCYAQLWEASTGHPVGPRMQHGDGVLSAVFSPDGRRIVTAGEDARAIVWDSESGRQITPPLLHDKRVQSAKFNLDGKWIVTAAADKSARVWNSETGDPLTPPLYHLNPLVSAGFLAGNKSLLTIDEKGEARIWKLPEDGRPVKDLISMAALLSGNCVPPAGKLNPPQGEALESIWHRLRLQYPSTFETSTEEVVTWHEFQAEECEMEDDWQGAAFHLEKLVMLRPGNQSISNRLGRAQIKVPHLSSTFP